MEEADFVGYGVVRRVQLDDAALGEFILPWDDVRAAADPHATAVGFLREIFAHSCDVCAWDPGLAATAEGHPPPVA